MSLTTKLPLRLVIFDCDGVLVDSEGPSNRALAEEITKLGWPMDEAEATRRFIGYQLKQVAPVVEAHLGCPVPAGWVELLDVHLMTLTNAVASSSGAADHVKVIASLVLLALRRG